ncbi:hypothetical protein Dsin_024833 [Dipteronia sinensis]|uniref:HAT C-terminal dimerisation domain-containing protein n=1 Tax=Dipteronia sinensis TaxID=43782 RepID=A0AAD9ZW42_9ROSI|nr:hypothetical protein Dsin_024833 [Dipteronia sinensis]
MKGKGRMTDNLGHDNRAYHEYLQQQVYAEDLGLNFPQSHSHPSLRISEPDLNVTPILTSQSENMPDLGHDGDEPDPNPHQDFDFYPQIEEKLPKQVKSDLFVLHMKKVTHEDGSTVVICNYCKKVFKWHKSGGYGSYRKHITNSHPDAQAKSSSQSQIPSFGENVGFNNYCQLALNPDACRVPRTTLTEALENIYEKEKKMLEKFLEKYNGRVSVCADIWSDHWQMHSYIGVTCHYMDNAWTIQKRILAFRVFDEKHTAANIFRHLRIIFTEYKIENKIFAIGFDNASNNTAVIPALIELCKPYLGGSSSSSSTTYSELESYLSTSFGFIEDTEDKKFDILYWWKEHERYFPILAMIAKQILSTPVSTVAVEQQFSAGGNILDPKRSLMSPKSLQIQACVEDWTKAQYRQQEIDQEEPYDFFKDDQPAES